MKIGSATGCHQMHSRSFSIFNYQFPVCARCTGLAIGQITGFGFSFVLLKYSTATLLLFALISLFLLGFDGVGQYFGKWESTNLRRLITGLLCGFFVILFLNKIIYELIFIIAKLSIFRWQLKKPSSPISRADPHWTAHWIRQQCMFFWGLGIGDQGSGIEVWKLSGLSCMLS